MDITLLLIKAIIVYVKLNLTVQKTASHSGKPPSLLEYARIVVTLMEEGKSLIFSIH